MKNVLIGLMVALLGFSAFAGFIDERSNPQTGATTGTAATTSAAAELPKADLTLVLRPGDLVSEKVTEWARRNGYALTWTASEYRSGADLVLADEFEKSLDMFLGSMRLNRVRLEAEIYANKAVRILEVK